MSRSSWKAGTEWSSRTIWPCAEEIGINYAAHQIIDLITNGVDGIHIYTMNKPEIAQSIFGNIPTVLKELNHD